MVNLETSILDDIKKPLGLKPNYEHFDEDIIMHINTAFMTLMQLGVGPKEGFSIKDNESKWIEFDNRIDTQSLKTYIYLKVRLLFDPPSNSFLVDSIKRNIDEIEWRLNVQVDKGEEE